MSEPLSPLDELLEGLRSALAARRRDATTRIERVESALAAYRRAVEQQLASDFAAEHRLKAPAKTAASVVQAAEALRDAVLELPDVGRLLTRPELLLAPADLEANGPMTLKAPPVGKASAGAAPGASAWPRLQAALASQKLVVIGALSRDRSDSVPHELASGVEWIDTERDGAHALGNLPQRIRQGRVAGVVILDRSVKHKHSEPALAAARDAHVPAAFAGQGGRASLERALSQLEGMLGAR